jgi:serine/threonine protein kinase
MPADPRRVKELFVAAADLPPADRPAFLDRECADNPELRQRVEQLLLAHDQPASALDRPFDLDRTNPRPPSVVESTATVGDRVGPYKLLEKIGEGGMGEVWVADQLEPIKRRVALKLIKPGMDSRSVLGRFEAERQALAVMDHPNIAKVLDAGQTSDGRPYFVMELVKGTPITEFADARKLTTQQRLELFVPVCQAIQHAHMKGIIHRDIKPSNVLVELHDDRMVPKVIDFGVAKAVGQQLTERTIYTGFGALVGTPAYMAPEQATFNALDVDTRADVYALGVLLYELLAGSPPIEKDRLKKAALDEVLRIVREEEPPRPSQRLSTADTRASIAATRGSEPAKLSALMKGELDWIVMKALEKDRTRRYETANGFAADVQRYLSGEPVQAVPPSVGYRLRKFVRKNRGPVLVGLTFTLMLLTGVAVATLLAIQARRAELVARDKEREAQEQRQEAEDNKNAWLKVSEVYFDAAIEAEIRSSSARLDADLLEYKADPRVGLLRLARPLNTRIRIPALGPNFSGDNFIELKGSELTNLREFQAAAVISAGQEFVPLVPPLDSGNWYDEVSPDGRLYILPPEQTGLKLLAFPSLAERGVLREAGERVVRWGFSSDSQTAWTQDADSVVRFWNTDGRLRAKTPLRPERFVYPAGMTAKQVRYVADSANPVRVADGIVVVHARPPVAGKPGKDSDDWNGFQQPPSPMDMYSTRTGQFIRRLDYATWTMVFQFAASNRWLIYQAEKSDVTTGRRDIELVIVSTADGRELARLVHPVPEKNRLECDVSPSGKWVVTHHKHQAKPGGDWVIDAKTVQLWRSTDWKPVTDSALNDAIAAIKRPFRPGFITDDLLSLWWSPADGGYTEGLIRIGSSGSWTPRSALANQATLYDESPTAELGGTLHRFGRDLTDGNTFQRLKPPPGRRYAAELATLAPDGRFWESLDTVTEKDLPYHLFGGKYFPGFGHVGVRRYLDEFDGNRGVDNNEIRILPDPKRLDIPPEMLELWAQVVVGGELGPEGSFQPWDQPTWAAKQKELAAMKPPYADFPFPGWVAQDPHQWLLIRAHEMPQNQARADRIREWRRLTGRTRPEPEPDTWRTKETLPPPRADK